MKKITLFLCILIIGFANAQNDHQDSKSGKLTFVKGSQFVNLNLSISSRKTEFTTNSDAEETKTFTFNLAPSYSYAISDDLFLGIGLGFSSSNGKSQLQGTPEIENSAKGFEVFPFIRYYKGIGKRLAFFLQGEGRYSLIKTKIQDDTDRKIKTFFIGVRPGITYMLSKNLGLEATIGSLGYRNNNIKQELSNIESDEKNFDFTLNASNLFFGLSYYF